MRVLKSGQPEYKRLCFQALPASEAHIVEIRRALNVYQVSYFIYP
uniref:Myosin motor domain-containing protein n=1 Tax=Ascaris lumbricoides TaxID=6252 RepID=A0A0M3HLJ9_ASCLU